MVNLGPKKTVEFFSIYFENNISMYSQNSSSWSIQKIDSRITVS